MYMYMIYRQAVNLFLEMGGSVLPPSCPDPSLPARCICLSFRGNHLSNTTSLNHVFFKSGEECGTLW